jgi:hypothetical protein
LTWLVSRLLHLYHCHACGQRFGCVSDEHVRLAPRLPGIAVLFLLLLVLLVGLSWFALTEF